MTIQSLTPTAVYKTDDEDILNITRCLYKNVVKEAQKRSDTPLDTANPIVKKGLTIIKKEKKNDKIVRTVLNNNRVKAGDSKGIHYLAGMFELKGVFKYKDEGYGDFLKRLYLSRGKICLSEKTSGKFRLALDIDQDDWVKFGRPNITIVAKEAQEMLEKISRKKSRMYILKNASKMAWHIHFPDYVVRDNAHYKQVLYAIRPQDKLFDRSICGLRHHFSMKKGVPGTHYTWVSERPHKKEWLNALEISLIHNVADMPVTDFGDLMDEPVPTGGEKKCLQNDYSIYISNSQFVDTFDDALKAFQIPDHWGKTVSTHGVRIQPKGKRICPVSGVEHTGTNGMCLKNDNGVWKLKCFSDKCGIKVIKDSDDEESEPEWIEVDDKKVETIVETCDARERVEEKAFHTHHKCVAIQAGMGAGKTYQLVKYLNGEIANDADLSVLAISTRIAFSLAQMKAFEGMEFAHYKEDEEKTMKADRLVCQYESIGKFAAVNSHWDVVVLDELRSLLSNAIADTNGRYASSNLKYIIHCIQKASKVIVLDADYGVDGACREFLHKYIGSDNVFEDIYKNKPQSMARNYRVCLNSNEETFIQTLFKRIRAGKRIVICSATKKWAHEIYAKISGEFNINIGIWTGDSSTEHKMLLRNINEEWRKYDVVIYTSVITVGCDYTEPVDDVFAFANGKGANARTLNQMIGRVRNLKGTVYMMMKQRSIHTRKKPVEISSQIEEKAAQTTWATGENDKLEHEDFFNRLVLYNRIEDSNSRSNIYREFMRLATRSPINKWNPWFNTEDIVESVDTRYGTRPEIYTEERYNEQSIISDEEYATLCQKRKNQTTTEEDEVALWVREVNHHYSLGGARLAYDEAMRVKKISIIVKNIKRALVPIERLKRREMADNERYAWQKYPLAFSISNITRIAEKAGLKNILDTENTYSFADWTDEERKSDIEILRRIAMIHTNKVATSQVRAKTIHGMFNGVLKEMFGMKIVKKQVRRNKKRIQVYQITFDDVITCENGENGVKYGAISYDELAKVADYYETNRIEIEGFLNEE